MWFYPPESPGHVSSRLSDPDVFFGNCLFFCPLDKTTRSHGQMQRKDLTSIGRQQSLYIRPKVHHFELVCREDDKQTA